MVPLLVRRQPLPGLPEDRRVARRVLHVDERLRRQRDHVHRRHHLGLRPDEDARRPAGDRTDLPPLDVELRAPAVDARREDPAAGRLTELLSVARHLLQPLPLEVPRRLRDPGQLHARRPNLDHRGWLHRALRRRHLHPAGGNNPEARLARGPSHVPARLSQLRRSRVAGRDPQRGTRRRRWRALVRDPQPRRHAGGLPAEHVRARHEVPLDGQRGDGSLRRHRRRLQPVQHVHPPDDRLHGTRGERPAEHAPGPDHPGQRNRIADLGPEPLGRLQLDGGRPRG